MKELIRFSLSGCDSPNWGLAMAGLCLFTLCIQSSATRADEATRPNIVLILADDLGYADIGVYGDEGIATPNLDRLAREGVRFTDFHVAQAVCSASRAAIMTGCYPDRVGLTGAIEPWDKIGIHRQELTLPQLLKRAGYATGMVGKWHLGRPVEFLPTHRGFDEYFGLPYSNDQWPFHPEKPGVFPPLPLIEGDRVVKPEITADDMNQLTTWYTQRAISFIERNKDRRFFLYVAHTMPHVPLGVGDKFRGKSRRGLYGDACEEIDWSTGEILAALQKQGLENNTLVMFLSDNGPWLSYGNHGGSAHPLREGKTTSWEGGTRVPFIARWPGQFPAGAVVDEIAMSIDLLPTIARLAGVGLPELPIDGLDIWPLLSAQPNAKNPHDAYYFYGVPFGQWTGAQLEAVRSGRWKLILPHTYRTLGDGSPGHDGLPAKYQPRSIVEPELYDLEQDIREANNLAAQHPGVVKRLLALAERCRDDLGDTVANRPGNGVRQPGVAIIDAK